jgi:hypothetical protein
MTKQRTRVTTRQFSALFSSRPNNYKPTGRFTKENQPKKRGRPPGARNVLSKNIKEAAVNAATRYGVDGTGLGGLEGFFFRCCDLYGQTMIALLGRISPLQKSPDGERQKTVYNTPEEFDAALKARGLPSLTHMLALEREHMEKINGKAKKTKR